MNKEQVSGQWQMLKGKIREAYSDLTDDEVEMFKGKKDQFFGAIKQRYGIAKEQAEKQINKLESDCGCSSSDSRSTDRAA